MQFRISYASSLLCNPFFEAQYSIGIIPMPVKVSKYHHPLFPISCKRLTVTLAKTFTLTIL